MTETYYMHTLDGTPAEFDGYQVCYANRSPWGRGVTLRLTSLRQLRREQRLSRKNRHADALSDNDVNYGYVRVRVEDPPDG